MKQKYLVAFTSFDDELLLSDSFEQFEGVNAEQKSKDRYNELKASEDTYCVTRCEIIESFI